MNLHASYFFCFLFYVPFTEEGSCHNIEEEQCLCCGCGQLLPPQPQALPTAHRLQGRRHRPPRRGGERSGSARAEQEDLQQCQQNRPHVPHPVPRSVLGLQHGLLGNISQQRPSYQRQGAFLMSPTKHSSRLEDNDQIHSCPVLLVRLLWKVAEIPL